MIEIKWSTVVEATCKTTGIRSRFKAVEHFNVGEGWMMRDIDRKHRGIVGSDELVDMVELPRPGDD